MWVRPVIRPSRNVTLIRISNTPQPILVRPNGMCGLRVSVTVYNVNVRRTPSWHQRTRGRGSDTVCGESGLPSAARPVPIGCDPLPPRGQRVVFAGMPAASVFFRDPDGRLLDYMAMLPHEPRPEQGVVPWDVWELTHRAGLTSEPSQTPR